jgi:hypothetical protein
MAKISRPILYTGLLALAAVAWVMTSEEPAKTKCKTIAKKAASTAKDKLGFLPEDYDPPEFEPVLAGSASKFQPLVSRTQTASSLALAPDAVPAELAGGDPNWVYTGTAEIDGKPTALLENRVTAESDFVNQGQKWKRSEVTQILPQSLILAGPSGRKIKLTLSNGEAVIGTGPGADRLASGFRPVNPALSGPIGNGITIRPDRNGQRNGLETRDAN